MGQNFVVKLKQASYIIAKNVTSTRTKRRIIERFANSNGMVYFGSVDSKKDDHKLIRGATASSSHKDNHYCVGTISGYDVSLIERSDFNIDRNGKSSYCDWLIVSVDLKNGSEVPHIFVGSNNHELESYEPLFMSENTFSKIKLGVFENYPEDFVSRYSVYSPICNMIETQKLFPASSMRVLGSHLWPFSFEIKNESVYIYSKNDRISQNTLTSMLNIGIWVARHLDYMINQI